MPQPMQEAASDSKPKSASRSRDARPIAGLFACFLGAKSLMVALAIVALAATNVATLLSSSFHDMMYTGARKALLIGGQAFADYATRKSPTRVNDDGVRRATKDLSERNQALVDKNKNLTAAHDELKTRNAKISADAEGLKAENTKVKSALSEMEARHAKTSADLDDLRTEHKKVITAFSDLEVKTTAGKKTAKEVATAVNGRLAKGVARNTAAIPAESLPYVGIGVTLSVTALDIYDACETMKDINGLLVLLGQGQVNPDFCGTKFPKLPTTKQVVDGLSASWKASMESVTAEVKRVPAGISIPEVRLPTAAEAKSVICPVFGGLSWITC